MIAGKVAEKERAGLLNHCLLPSATPLNENGSIEKTGKSSLSDDPRNDPLAIHPTPYEIDPRRILGEINF